LKKIAALVLVGIFALGLTGCGDGEPKGDDWQVTTVQLKDGASVECVMHDNGWDSGQPPISCDWDNRTNPNKDK
jgi:hypothetical protein